jgi:hypothetical protein
MFVDFEPVLSIVGGYLLDSLRKGPFAFIVSLV